MVVVAPLLFKTLIRGNYQAIALWPFIVLKYKERRHDKVLINHERIHLRQQLECLILPFYIIYLTEYGYHRLGGKSHFEAYKAISYEKEAYSNETNLEYLKTRKRFANFQKPV
jgi:hypothetical protein